MDHATNRRSQNYFANILIEIGQHLRDDLDLFGFGEILDRADEQIFFPPSKTFLEDVIETAKKELGSNQREANYEFVILYAQLWLDWTSPRGPTWTFLKDMMELAEGAGMDGVRSNIGRLFESERQRRRAKKANLPYKQSRDYCVARAKILWEADPTCRMGIMTAALSCELKEQALFVPKENKLREWLNTAKKEGDLIIPKDAQRPGRPKVS